MLRRDQLALTRRDGEARDPDIIDRRLEDITVHTGGPAGDLHMADFVKWDPWDREAMRLKQVMYLGRYGRQPAAQWGDMDIEEFRAHYEALGDIVREEGALKRGLEDL